MNDYKKELKELKKQIKYSNWAVRGFMRAQQYQKGSYRKLQKTAIWRNGKQWVIKYYELLKLPMICPICQAEITSNPLLHHKKYNWKKLFNPKNIKFLHYDCHQQLHDIRRGYKRSSNIAKSMLKAFLKGFKM
ncbi:MAG: hypothetical protein ACFFCI_11080 [Promethearchaeota archaeon]